MPRPPVDIIIPFHGQHEALFSCLESIISCTPDQDYQITVVDDGSPASISPPKNKRIQYLRNEEQKGFATALHTGFKATKHPWIVFMHSDVRCSGIHWLIELQRSLVAGKENNVKLVSSRLTDPGTAADYDDSLIADLKQKTLNEDFIATKAVPLTCCLFNRELFKRIGGFLKLYPFAWYEDVELFHRMIHYGFKQSISCRSWVYHKGGSTIKSIWQTNSKSKKVMEENYNKCLDDIKLFVKTK